MEKRKFTTAEHSRRILLSIKMRNDVVWVLSVFLFFGAARALGITTRKTLPPQNQIKKKILVLGGTGFVGKEVKANFHIHYRVTTLRGNISKSLSGMQASSCSRTYCQESKSARRAFRIQARRSHLDRR